MLNKLSVLSFALASLINAFTLSASAQTSAFTYQGRLNDNGAAASGLYELQFTLNNAVTEGGQIGSAVTLAPVSVSNGLFTVQLDFGNSAFDGSARWLEVGVRTNGSVSAYTTLSPRQLITSAPYAVQAANAAVALVANNATSVSAANISGALTLAQLPTGVVTNNATNVNITGTFTGAGTFTWRTISGTNQQAVSNTGYFVTNNTQVTLTLPTSPALGDIVRVSGGGLGGWKIKPSGSQTIVAGNLNTSMGGQVWTPRESVRAWSAVASSLDGSKLVAVVNPGQIYTSTDFGVTWAARETHRAWSAVASSSDGTKLVATVNGGYVYTSTDSGVTWTARFTNSTRTWMCVSSSSDGAKLVVSDASNTIAYSSDFGVTWTGSASDALAALASSSDGTKVVGAEGSSPTRFIWTSTDSGASWTQRATNRNWKAVASSSDGSKLVATVKPGQIYTSTDFGVSWTARDASRFWEAVASSSDGTRLVAASSSDGIFTSPDSGVTWTLRDNPRNWVGVASSSDATRLVAVVNNGQIYTSETGTTVTTGYMAGLTHSAVELQYIGNNKWIPLSHEGTITTN